MASEGALQVYLGDSGVLHALQTSRGIMFSMSEVASTIFHEIPSLFGKEIRKGRYNKQHTQDKEILQRLAEFNILPESSTYTGATLLSPRTLEELLKDYHKFDLVPILKIALMRMVTQEAAILMGHGKHGDALTLALDAIKQGQRIFYPKAPLQLVPLYLLAVQVCLSLGRTTQSQELLGIASWLFIKDKGKSETYETQAEISRLFGQLYVLQDIQKFREQVQGDLHLNTGDICFTIGLLYLHNQYYDLSLENLNKASAIYSKTEPSLCKVVDDALSIIEDRNKK